MKKITPQIVKQVVKDQKVRRAVVSDSHIWFFNIYLSHYVKYPSAKFHKDLFGITEDEKTSLHCVTAFRNCAKTTLITLSYPIWAILGKQKKKFVVIVSQTQRQAKMHLYNIKSELEGNSLLRKDLGPFHEESDEWGSYSLVIPKYNAKIMAVSMEQSIRGYRFREYRPDLIIADDVENLESIRTKESRDKTYNWITGEIIPAGDKGTKIIFLGNLLHEDCLLMRLKDKISNGHVDGKHLEIPLLDDNDNIAWPGKYPTMADIKIEEKKQINEIAWQREFLLKIVPEEGRIILPEHLEYYDELPPQNQDNEFRDFFTGVDLAMSLKSSADCTAMVSVALYGYGKDIKIYVLPNPTNERMVEYQILDRAKQISDSLGKGKPTKLFIEDIGGQRFIVQGLQKDLYPAEGVTVRGSKRDRLQGVAYLIQQGVVKFPKTGVDLLKTQLINFGVEKHDDLVDALTLVLGKVLEMNHKEKSMGIAAADRTGKIFLYNGKELESQEDWYKRLHELNDRGCFI